MRLTSVLTSILLLPLCVAALPISSAQAEAPNPGDVCEQELEREASQLIFDLTLELGRHNSLSSDEFSRIEKPLQTLRAHGQSPQALSCFGQYPLQKERYENWFRLQSHKVVTKTGQRLDQVCARQTRIFITTQKLHIDSAVAKNRLAKASKLAAKMEKSLRKSTMMSQCPTTKKRVDRLLGSYLPEIINQAALPKVLGDMSKSYFQAKHKVDAGMLALQSEGATMIPVPGGLDQAQGEAALRHDLGQCTLYATILSELGAGADTLLQPESGETLTLADASEFCTSTKLEMPQLTLKFATHNRTYQARALNKWRRHSIKGWGMERIFNSKGRPIAESQGGKGLLWVYSSQSVADKTKAECTTYRFSNRGKLLGNHSSPCPR